MNRSNFTKAAVALFVIAFTLSSCEAIAGIFKAGVWVGVIIVVVIIAVIFWLINKSRK
ncbi:MAG: phosphatidate cytidylyltransferase [Ginsengibacter sp.]